MSVNNSLVTGAGVVLTALGVSSRVFVPDACKAAINAHLTVMMDKVCPAYATTNIGLVWIIVAGGVLFAGIGLWNMVQNGTISPKDVVDRGRDAAELFKGDDK